MSSTKRIMSPAVIEQRNAFIVEAVNAGMTGEKLGAHFGITRERVCQIYYRLTGKSMKQLRMEQYIATERLRIAKKPPCKQCGNPIVSPHRFAFCSKYCREKAAGQRREKVAYPCTACGKDVHPYETGKYRKTEEQKIANHYFCNRACYAVWRKKAITPYMLKIKARNDRIVELLLGGTPEKEILATGISYSHLHNVLHKYHITSADIDLARMKQKGTP